MATSKNVPNSALVEQNKNVQTTVSSLASADIYQPPPRYIVENGKRVLYKGPGLVSEDGKLLTSNGNPYYYDLESDSRKFYAGMSATMRIAVTEQLVAGGFLNPNGIGDYVSELGALQELLDYANTTGKEWNFALKDRVLTGPSRRIGTGRTYRTTNAADLSVAVKKVAQNVIGREVSDAEAADFARQYQQQEVAAQKAAYSGGTTMDQPSLETAATQFVKSIKPTEAAGYQYLGYMNKLFNAIGVQ